MRKHLILLPLASALLLASQASARAQMASDPILVKECASCHLAFSAGWLTQESWKKVMGSLDNHFGDDARLPEERRAAVESVLLAGAGDAKTGRASPFLKSVKGDPAPIRLTETFGFQRKHGKIKLGAAAMARIKSLANCVACHPKAAEGVFED
ncbi:MAG: cytochrome C [Alphaproteobacteria bacterium]|nr:cytochrome C [Alphaproteobacteria bacterium]